MVFARTRPRGRGQCTVPWSTHLQQQQQHAAPACACMSGESGRLVSCWFQRCSWPCARARARGSAMHGCAVAISHCILSQHPATGRCVTHGQKEQAGSEEACCRQLPVAQTLDPFGAPAGVRTQRPLRQGRAPGGWMAGVLAARHGSSSAHGCWASPCLPAAAAAAAAHAAAGLLQKWQQQQQHTQLPDSALHRCSLQQ